MLQSNDAWLIALAHYPDERLPHLWVKVEDMTNIHQISIKDSSHWGHRSGRWRVGVRGETLLGAAPTCLSVCGTGVQVYGSTGIQVWQTTGNSLGGIRWVTQKSVLTQHIILAQNIRTDNEHIINPWRNVPHAHLRIKIPRYLWD